jgi:hypothetical protein
MTAIKRSETITASTSLVTTDTAQTVPGVKTFSNGIKLGNNETLSVYDEGTWTPSVTANGTPGTVTHSIQQGTYVKIGKMVTVSGRVTITNWTGSPTGGIAILGLPFISEAFTRYHVLVHFSLPVTGDILLGEIVASSNYLNLYGVTTSSGVFTAVAPDTSFELFFAFTYISAT